MHGEEEQGKHLTQLHATGKHPWDLILVCPTKFFNDFWLKKTRMQLLDVEIKLFNLKYFFNITLKNKKMLTLP